MKKIEKYKLNVNGIDCVGCSTKVEKEISKMSIITEATIDFVNKKLIVNSTERNKDKLIKEIQILVDKMGKNIKFSFEKEENVGYAKEIKNLIIKLLIGVIFYIIGFFIPEKNILKFVSFFISYLIIGGEVLSLAIKNIIKGEVFDENFLMMIATIGAFVIGEYPEAVAVMLFYEVGELFQGYAINKSRKSIADMMDIKPEYANVIRDNKSVKVEPDEVQIDEIIEIKPGERVPLDAIIIKGETTLDTSALTGESLPVEVREGATILSGCINQNALILAKVTKEYFDSTVNKVLDLVENAAAKKSTSERLITRFAKIYTPIVISLAVLLAILPPIISGEYNFRLWIFRALSFLVVSCPCAFVISVPLMELELLQEQEF